MGGRDEGIRSEELSWQPGRGEHRILDRVNINLQNGRFYGIIGPNGSGKTSLLRQILHFTESSGGSVWIEGKEVRAYRRPELAKKLALVPQNTVLATSFSAYEIVFMGRNPHQKRFAGVTAEDIEKVEEAMELASCAGFKDRQFQNLSGGEAQRVAVARAIAQDTPWLLLDEPVSSLDIRHQLELMETLKKLNRERGTSIVAVLHDINLAASYCSDLIMMKNGSVKYTGAVPEVLTCERLAEIFEVRFLKMEHPVTGNPYFLAER